MELQDILEQARQRGYGDGVADYPHSDNSDVADLIAEVGTPQGQSEEEWARLVREYAQIINQVAQAYAEGFGQGQVEMREAITLEEAAQRYQMAYSTLAQAVRENRLEARRSGRTWLTSRQAVEVALAAGKLRPRIATDADALAFVRIENDLYIDLGTGDLARALAAVLEARFGGHDTADSNGHILYFNEAGNEPTGDAYRDMYNRL